MYLQPVLLLLTFTLGGVTLKTSDFLGEKGNSILAFLSAAISALILGLLISESVFSSSLILGIIIGVILSTKVNKPNLLFGLFLTFIFAFYFELKIPVFWLLAAVIFFTFIDEFGHEKHSQKKGVVALFFRYRLSLKLALILLTCLSLIQTIHLIGFLCFDLSYDLTNYFLTNVAVAPINK